MKKVKLFLTATALVVLVGGAFAFAHKAQANVSYCDGANGCSLSVYSTQGTGSKTTLTADTYASNALTDGTKCTKVDDCLISGSVIVTSAYNNQ